VEDLSLAETAQVLAITADATRVQHLRTRKQLWGRLDDEPQP
jgi:hypothetical protein